MKRVTPAERHELAGLGRAVRHLRTSKGIGRSAFVAASGIGWDRLAAIEDGKFDPTYDELLALADALGVELATLVSFGAGVDKSAVCAAFGRRLRALRVEQDAAQDALAARAGVHRTVIGKLENGRTDPRLTTIMRLARGLDVPPGALVEGLTATDGDA